jgi:DNA-binding MarR family transcriptional regulator
MENSPAAQKAEPDDAVNVAGEVNVAVHPLDPLLRAFQMLQMNSQHVTSRVASAAGIGATDLRALLFIATSGGATPKQTGDFLELTSGAMTNLIDRMEAARFVERVPNPADRRSLVIHLAPEGIKTVGSIVDFYRRAFAASVASEDVAFVTAAFHAIGDSLTQTAADDISGPNSA